MQQESSYGKECKRWDAFLKASPLHFLRIKKGLWNNPKASFVRGQFPNRTSYIYANDVMKSGGSFEDYLNQKILEDNLTMITIQGKKRNGTGSLDVDGFEHQEYNVEAKFKELHESKKKPISSVTTKETLPMNTEAEHNGHVATTKIPPVNYNHVVHAPSPPGGLAGQVMHGMGGAAAAAAAAGLGLSAYVDLQKNADRYIETKDELQKVKAELHEMTLRNRTLETDLASAEKSKDLAVLSATLDKKGFFDSDAFQNLIQAAPELLAHLKQGGQSAPGLNSPSGASEAKSLFISYLNDPSVSDEMMEPLGRALFLMTESPQYIAALNQINQTYGQVNSGQANG